MAVISANVCNEVDLYIDQGADWSTSMDFFNQDGSSYDLTGYVFASSFRYSPDTPNIAGNLIVTVLNAPVGNAMLSIAGSTTANIPYGEYLYDVNMTDPYGTTLRVIQGTLTLRFGITSANGNVSWV